MLISSHSVFAKDNLYINSEHLVIDKNSKTASFKDNVLLCFKDIKLLGNKIIVYFEDEKYHKINKIIIEDGVKAEESSKNMIILGEHAVYNRNNSELEISGNVIVEEKGKIIVTDKIIFQGSLLEIQDMKTSNHKASQ